MDAVISEAPSILEAYLATLELFLAAAVGSFVLGNVVAVLYVSPLAPFRWAAAAYVRLVRNTPLPVVFYFLVFGLPKVGIVIPFFLFAVLSLTVYMAPFVAETLRSGVDAVPLGQVEAARSIGMSFGQTLRTVVFPQAIRSVVPPMASLSISLFKNTSIASAFFVYESMSNMQSLVNRYSSAVIPIMFTVAMLYVITGFAMGRGFAWLERRVEVLR